MLHSLHIRQFRCLQEVKLELPPARPVAFLGANAQGKTSILEAVCVLLRLQSPRSRRLGDCIRLGQAAASVEGQTEKHRLVVGLAPKSRRLRVDGQVHTRGADYLAESGLVVWMGNDDRDLIRGGAENRRRYLDFLASQVEPGYREALRAYERALRARNFLLKRDAQPRWDQIDAYGQVLAEHGRILTRTRSQLIDALTPHAQAAQQHLSAAQEALALRYENASGEDLASSFELVRDQEAKKRSTLVGPHRDDLTLGLNGLPAAEFASEGQQRSLAIALKLAQATLLKERHQTSPILLIDDVFGELDPERRNALLEHLPPDSQKLITSTTIDWMDDTRNENLVRYRLDSGSICPATK
ncbi:MAG: DNA replication and repair protein RecF [Verrucomicrobiota bacterium]